MFPTGRLACTRVNSRYMSVALEAEKEVLFVFAIRDFCWDSQADGLLEVIGPLEWPDDQARFAEGIPFKTS